MRNISLHIAKSRYSDLFERERESLGLAQTISVEEDRDY